MWQKYLALPLLLLLGFCLSAQSSSSPATKLEVLDRLNGMKLDLTILEISIQNSQKKIQSLQELIKLSQTETAEMRQDLLKLQSTLEESKFNLQQQIVLYNELKSAYSTLQKHYELSLKTIKIGKYVVGGLAVSLVTSIIISIVK